MVLLFLSWMHLKCSHLMAFFANCKSNNRSHWHRGLFYYLTIYMCMLASYTGTTYFSNDSTSIDMISDNFGLTLVSLLKIRQGNGSLLFQILSGENSLKKSQPVAAEWKSRAKASNTPDPETVMRVELQHQPEKTIKKAFSVRKSFIKIYYVLFNKVGINPLSIITDSLMSFLLQSTPGIFILSIISQPLVAVINRGGCYSTTFRQIEHLSLASFF